VGGEILSANEIEVADNGMRVLWVIWGLMLGSLCVYILICHLLADEVRGNVGSDFPIATIRNILYIAVVVTLSITYFFRNIMLSGNSGQSESNTHNLKLFTNQTTSLTKYTIVIIVSLGLSESIGIYGLILFFLGDSYQTFYIFIGISALAMFHFRPKRQAVEKYSMVMKTNEAIQKTHHLE